jgi:catechol 2,3-dioxygenase-like lactoylglutathione lyase family enzyme
MTATIPTAPRGLHHITAIAADAQKTIDFYTSVLGLRMVKCTVNQDDPNAYHLYFGDALGSPGTCLTFFVWPGAHPGQSGTGQASEILFNVPAGALPFWRARLDKAKMPHDESEYTGRPSVGFDDPDGIKLAVVESADAARFGYWKGGGIAAEYAIHGFHGIGMDLQEAEKTVSVLTGPMACMEAGAPRASVTELRSGDQSIYLKTAPDLMPGAIGTGTIHHVAWRVEDDAHEMAARTALMAAGLSPTPQIDRFYFKSVYYREPGGVLFELATAGPGFTYDEPAEELGTHLVLPGPFEAMRDRIASVLPPVVLPKPVPKDIVSV